MATVQLKPRPTAAPAAPAKKPAARPVHAKRRKPVTRRKINHARVAQRRQVVGVFRQGFVVFVASWICVSIAAYTMMLGARRDARLAQMQANSAHEESRRMRAEIDELNSPRELARTAAALRLYPGGVNVAEVQTAVSAQATNGAKPRAKKIHPRVKPAETLAMNTTPGDIDVQVR